jgi:hypothetical protein
MEDRHSGNNRGSFRDCDLECRNRDREENPFEIPTHQADKATEKRLSEQKQSPEEKQSPKKALSRVAAQCL